MPVANVTRSVDLNLPNTYLPHPAGRGMDEGYYIIYSASTAANTLNLGPGLVRGYRWGSQLPTTRNDGYYTLEGTIQIVSESITGSNNFVRYHGSNIIHIGRGVNDITDTFEDDAIFFAHLGQYGPTVQTQDEFFYWDRLFLAQGTTSWSYYQYHAHNPTSYPPFNNGRLALAADNRHGPVGIEEYGHMINIATKIGQTTYLSVMARVHTPSVGGAHNSHNDTELPSTVNKNYMMGGIINGPSDRFHAFYIGANGSQWDVYSRTYNYANSTFNAEVNHGTYDLADPQLAYTPGSSSLYPFRASTGKGLNQKLYIPTIYNSGSTGKFDLKIWELTSAATLAQNPIVYNILTGSNYRPDCHLEIANNVLYAAVSDGVRGGVSLYSYASTATTWSFEGQIVTNNVNKPLRVHGLNFNPAEFRFYTMISGEVSGSGITYAGPGVYSFSPDIPFLGYKHLDYLTGSNSFVLRDPLEAGYVQYDTSTGTLKRSGSVEPQGIDEDMPVLQYGPSSPQFFNRRQVGFGGSEAYNHGIQLKDGRQLFVGTKAQLDLELDISYTNGIISIFSPGETSPPEHYEIEGRFDDFITAVVQSPTDDKVYFTGFTKDLLVPRSELFIHAIGRGLVKSMMGPEKLEYTDMAIDLEGNQYYVGNYIDSSSIILACYDRNFELLWQRELSGGSLTDTAHGIAIDEQKYLYVAGKTNNSGSGNDDALLIKLNNSGSIEWAKTYGTSTSQYASSVTVFKNISTQYVALSVVSGSTTTILITDTVGNIVEQRSYDDLIVNRIRANETTTNGRYVIAGRSTGSPTTGKFGVGTLGVGLNWLRSYSSGSTNVTANDMRAVTNAPVGYVVVGTEGNDSYVMKIQSGSGGITKLWGTKVTASVFTAFANTPFTEPLEDQFTHVVGYTSASGNVLQGGSDGVIARVDYTGSLRWINTLGHTDNERINAAEMDVTRFNVITAGWSESHTDGRRGLLFRVSRGGYGTGNHHLEGAPGMAIWYLSSSALIPTQSLSTLGTLTTSSLGLGPLLVSASNTFTASTSSFMDEIYEGNRVFDGFMGILDLNDLQTFKNTSNYVRGGLNKLNNLVQFFQVGTAGDSEADDGNIFGYDIIELSNGQIALAAQTSGDIAKLNTGDSGVYDYLLAFYDKETQLFRLQQQGSFFDEEIYSLTEISGSKVAFVGRTSGDLGGAQIDPIGSYDIFLGIIDPNTLEAEYYSTGSGAADRGFNAHDLYPINGQPELLIVYESAGDFGGTNAGPNDIGVIRFNYDTDAWYSASLLGTAQSEFLDTLGHVSTITKDGRVAIVGSTTGIFADDGTTFGQSDMFLGIYDIFTNEWKKYQVGTGAADFARSVELETNNKIIIGGTTAASFVEPNDALTVEFDMAQGFKGKTT